MNETGPSSSSTSVAGDSTVFPILEGSVFLDHAAVAPLPSPVAEAMRRFIEDWSTRGPQAWAYQRIGRLRSLASDLIGAAGPHEIAITPNTSTGLGLVAAGLDLGSGDAVVTTDVEFPSNRYAWEARAGVDLTLVPPRDGTPFVHDDDLVAAMQERFPLVRGTRVLAISHVQFATGQCHDVARLAAAAHDLGGLICVDAIQSVGQLPVRCAAWELDFLSADGHKWMLGPEGTGIFRCAEAHLERLRPPIVGWLNTANAFDYDTYDLTMAPTAQRFEPGCHAMVGVAGMAAALELLLAEGIERIESQVGALAGALAEEIRSLDVRLDSPHGGATEPPGSGIVAARVPQDVDGVRLHAALTARGVRTALRRGRVRFSPHFYNTPAQIAHAGGALAEALRDARSA